jgi:RNA polymerase sigma-32 factor
MKPHLEWYFAQTRNFPILDADEERRLACEWRDTKDSTAGRQLLGSHLRLVIRIARGFGGYGIPLAELVAQGNLGLMRALTRFEPERGFRFATYAIWWIRAAIQEHAFYNHSLVTIGAGPVNKRLFFRLRRLKSELGEFGDRDLPPDAVTQLARQLEVSEDQIVEMNVRLAGMDRSLTAPMYAAGEAEWQNMLAADRPDQESVIAEASELAWRRDLLTRGLAALNTRERHILEGRRLRDEVMTLADLGDFYGVSRERVRQIEVRAFEKLQKAMLTAAEQRPPVRPERMVIPRAPQRRNLEMFDDRAHDPHDRHVHAALLIKRDRRGPASRNLHRGDKRRTASRSVVSRLPAN